MTLNKTVPLKRVFGWMAAIAALGCNNALVAQEDGSTPASSSTVLEEVTVTARKREESMQDVPIAISMMSGETINEVGLRNLEDITLYIPNVTVSESVNGTNLFIRGVGSGVNQGFEQSVGMFIDGIYMGRAFQARSPVMDLERVEVLKGPQGTLFGKNTIAGAFNITTARPTDEFEGYVNAFYNWDDGETSLIGVVSGPLSDTLSARFAARKYDLDGYIRNTWTGNDDPRRDEGNVRGSIRWVPNDRLELNAKIETGRFDVDGRHSQLSYLQPAILALMQTYDPQEDGILNYQRSIGGAGPYFGPEYQNTDIDNFAMTIDYSFETMTLTAVTGYSGYDYVEVVDGDFTPLSTANQDTDQQFDQWSQELRIASQSDGFFNYIAGLYFQDAELDSIIRTDVDTRQLLGAPIVGSRHNTFIQDSTSWAVFFEGTFNLSDRFKLTAGIRYTDETKDVYKKQVNNVLGSDTQADPASPLPALGWRNHEFGDKRSESDLTPAVSLQFFATDEIMTYVSATKGFKGGGYDEARADGNFDLFEYDEEEVISFEAGSKMVLLDGAATFNIAAFRSTFDNLQVSTFEGVNFVVGNAAEATTQGVEMDGRWRINEELVIGGALGYLDATYDSFPGAACYTLQTPEQGCVGGKQDLAGGTLQFAPDWAGNLNLEWNTGIGQSLELRTRVDFNYTDDILLANDNDPHPAQTQSAYGKIDARIGLASIDGGWELALIGRNLTDETTMLWANDLPLISRNNYFAHVDRPRTIAIQLNWAF